MVDLAVETIGQVDVLVVVHDASAATGGGDRYVLGLLDRATIPVILALNKIDLVPKRQLLPLIDEYRKQYEFRAIVPVSALTGDGATLLEAAILESLPEGDPLYPADYLTDQPSGCWWPSACGRSCCGTREPSCRSRRRWSSMGSRRPTSTGSCDCTVRSLVERASQKRIVIGRHGALIKRIGTEAREDLEQFFATKIYLDLHVRVRAGWREDERILGQLGLTPGRG